MCGQLIPIKQKMFEMDEIDTEEWEKTMSNEVTVTLEITLVPEAADGFAQMGGTALQATRDFDGCIDVRIVRHKDEANRFLFVERWASEAAYQAYIAWRSERGEFQALQTIATKVETNVWPTLVAST